MSTQAPSVTQFLQLYNFAHVQAYAYKDHALGDNTLFFRDHETGLLEPSYIKLCEYAALYGKPYGESSECRIIENIPVSYATYNKLEAYDSAKRRRLREKVVGVGDRVACVQQWIIHPNPAEVRWISVVVS